MSDQFCLKWNNHHTTLVAVFDKLFECESLVDCTVAAEGKYVKAHKVVLSACSSYLEELLLNHDDKHPILIFNDISYVELKAMLEYMYRGEVNVSQDQLNTFLKAAEALRIKGLTTDQGGGDGGGGGGAAGSGELNDLRKKLPRKEARTNSPVLGTTPVERPPSPKRKRRMSSRDENYANDSNSCDTAPTPPPASGHNAVTKTEEKLGRLKRDGGGGADTPGLPPVQTSTPHHKLLQPKTEFIEEPSNTEDDMAVLEDEEDYGPNPGTSQASFSSQDFNNWPLGDGTGDEVFMGGQHDMNNTAGNSQGKPSMGQRPTQRLSRPKPESEGGEEGEDMASQHYCLRWNNYQSNMTSVFHHLLRTQSFVDVTLACNDQSLKAHKVVLSACSSYFQKLLLENPCKHPTIIMPQDVCFTDLKFIIEFVYKGEIDVSQAQLQSLLKTADQLKIKGLCEVPEGKSGAEVTPLSPSPVRKSCLSVKKRRLASVKRRHLYRERLMQQTGVRRVSDRIITVGDISSRVMLKKDVEASCINVGTGTEEVKEMPVVVVNQSASGINNGLMIASPQPLQALQPATPHSLQPTSVANEVNQSTQVEVEMTVEPPAPSATLVSTTTMDIQTTEPTTTHRDIAIDSSDLDAEENDVKVKFETLRSMDRVDHMEIETHMTNGAVQTNVNDDPSMHTMMITPELLGLIPSSNSENGDMDHGKASLGGNMALSTLASGGKAWTKEDMEAALDALRKQTMSLSKASAHYGIPSTTLWQRAHRLGIDTPKKDGPAKSWTEDNLNTALDALRQGSISANKASKAFGIPSSTLYKIARREGIRLAAPFNAAPTSWVPEDLERALEAIRTGQFTVQRAATEYGIPSGTLYGRCKREGIELSRNNPTPWSEDAMMEALEAVRVGQMSINQAAIHYNLPYSSLYGRFKRVKYEAEGLSGSETETSEQHGPVIQQQTTPTHPSPSAQQPTHPAATHVPPPSHPPQPTTHSQPQIMLVQYQQPLQMYQSAT